MSAGRTWPPRSTGPGGGAGFTQSQMAWNPAKFLAPEVAVDSTGGVISGTAVNSLGAYDFAVLGGLALVMYLAGARHMGGRMIPFKGMSK